MDLGLRFQREVVFVSLLLDCKVKARILTTELHLLPAKTSVQVFTFLHAKVLLIELNL